MNRMKDRTFTCTNTGYILNAGPGPRQGDKLCILFGCREPAVLRKRRVDRTGRELYELIAFAWTHGVMDGEFVKGGYVERGIITLA